MSDETEKPAEGESSSADETPSVDAAEGQADASPADDSPASPAEPSASAATSSPAPPPEPQAPSGDAPPALTEDQLSGALFRRFNGGALVLGLLFLFGAAFLTRGGNAPPPETGSTFDPLRFTGDARWDQGSAEVARYDAVRVLYSQEQAYELIRIAVKERFDPAQGVKGEGPGALDAIKTIAVHDTPTHRAYRYRQQVVVQVPRRDPRQVLAASMSSQEWCGSTFVRLRAGAERSLERTIHSYFAGEADARDRLAPGTLLADQLPFLVRTIDWKRAPTLDLLVLPTLLSNHGKATQPQPTRLERVAEETLETPAGTFPCVHVRVLRTTPSGQEVDHYWVSTGKGRPLVRFQDATGIGLLRALEWSTYWEDPK